MKITDVEAIYVRLPDVKPQCDSGQDALVVRVRTVEGITGIGVIDYLREENELFASNSVGGECDSMTTSAVDGPRRLKG